MIPWRIGRLLSRHHCRINKRDLSKLPERTMNNRSAIIIIDLLKGFFKQNPTLPDPLNAKQLFAAVRRVIDTGREQGLHNGVTKHNILPDECRSQTSRSARTVSSNPGCRDRRRLGPAGRLQIAEALQRSTRPGSTRCWGTRQAALNTGA